MRTAVRRGLRFAAQLLLTLAATYFLFRSLRLSWGELATVELRTWRPRLLELTLSIVILLGVFVYLVALWGKMVSALGGPRLKLRQAVAIFFIANLGRYVPGKIWQLAGLTYLAGRQGVSLPVASSAAILGQILSLGAAAAVAAAALLLNAAAGIPRELIPWAAAFGALVLLVVGVPPALRGLLRVAFRLGKGPAALPALDPWFGLRWLGLYLPAWIGYGVAFGLLWAAFPPLPAVSWTMAMGGFAGAYFLGYAAIFAPAGVGVREGTLALLLAPWTGAAQATVLALIARIWMTVAELVPVLGVALSGAGDWLARE